MKIWPFDIYAPATQGQSITLADLKRGLEPFEKIRRAVGDKIEIMAELHSLWSYPAALRICHAHGVPVVPQGGMTGLAGGAVPQAGAVALSLDRMQRIERVDGAAATLTVQAGVTLQAAQEAAKPLSLVMIDIDFFKKFNDSHGHLLGDEVLKLVARSLVSGVKGRDTVARYGGEEFGIILPETSLGNAHRQIGRAHV